MTIPTLALVESIFLDGTACGDCPFCREDRERLEFWGTPCTRVEYSCEVLEGKDGLTPWNCPGIDAGEATRLEDPDAPLPSPVH